MSPSVHPSAVVSDRAELGEGVTVGPLAIVEAGAVLGPGCRVEGHALVCARARLGRDNVIHAFAVIGGAPQDRRYRGEPTTLEVGDGNVFREHVTVHRGTEHGGGVTRIGSGCLFMVGAHVAHDALVADGVTLANNTLLGGHVRVDAHAITGGQVAVAPFVRIGTRAFLAGGAMVEHDVPPFVIAAGDRARVRALNKVGLARAGVSEAQRASLGRAFRAIFRGDEPRSVAAARLASDPDPLIAELARFVLSSNGART